MKVLPWRVEIFGLIACFFPLLGFPLLDKISAFSFKFSIDSEKFGIVNSPCGISKHFIKVFYILVK